MTDEERTAWRREHVREAPEEGVLVTVTLGLVSFNRFASTGDINVRMQLALPSLPNERVRAVNTMMEMAELAEVVAVLAEYAPESAGVTS